MRCPAGVSLAGRGVVGGAGEAVAASSAGGDAVRWQAVHARAADSSSAVIGRTVIWGSWGCADASTGRGGATTAARRAHAATTGAAYDAGSASTPGLTAVNAPCAEDREHGPGVVACTSRCRHGGRRAPRHRPRGEHMDKTSNLPMALLKANLDLQARLGELLQQGGRQWLEQGTRTAGESAAQFQAEAARLLQAGDWQGLAALPMETFWRQAGQQAGEGDAAAKSA